MYSLDWPPFSFYDKKLQAVSGVSTDIVGELMRRGGALATAPRIVPWARALAVTKLQSNSCLVPMARTPDREASFQWIGPIGKSEWTFFARIGDHLELRKLEDAHRYRIGTIIGDLSAPYLQEKNFRIDLAPSDELNIKKLEARHIDLWSSGLLPGREFLREYKISDVEPIFTFLTADLYLACQHEMKQSEVARLNDILKSMYLDGTINNIYRRYGYEKEAPIFTH